MFEQFNANKLDLTKYLFYTGKGGVGKTSVACATAVDLADSGKKVLLISTDPASNLQDVFHTELSNKETKIKEIPNLSVVNLNPEEAAREYRDSMINPYKGKLPEAVLKNMEEQLSGSCTVEIAAFNEFSNYLADKNIKNEYECIIFDTAPTGHTLRMLQLPSAWTNFISESTHGASCLGQLSGLEDRKEIYKEAVQTLANGKLTTLILVTRPEISTLLEAKRASGELSQLGINNQMLIINGVMQTVNKDDEVSLEFYNKQQNTLKSIPNAIKDIKTYAVPLRSYNVSGIDNIRMMLKGDSEVITREILENTNFPSINDLINDLYKSKKKVIFTMGKGGVGKTTVASTIALGLSQKGVKVHLTTTDPANHIKYIMGKHKNITISEINEQEELRKYQDEVISKASKTMSGEDLEYIKEDLRSPCTQEIAVFRAFAKIVEKADDEVVVIDTAPTGHTLLLLDSTQSYHKEVERTQGDIPKSVKKLLPRLRDENETDVVIVTLPETTPVYEAERLNTDLKRAGIHSKWWVINSSLLLTGTKSTLLQSKAQSEIKWINEVTKYSNGNYTIVKWLSKEVNDTTLLEILKLK
ncbi:arsenic ABC transporter ATPase [Clostridium tetani]|uniref:Arsenical pump-driving ATPase n=1 Tax=Clostridium tetani TaxID=1513 RepID=A0ABY0ENJ1_CLOTA|nr:arsenical pump-driving ATPase [Clostridium tetani]KHO38544.1 arsenic ABC transporter ATPase [Clostridium tetani]RXI54980.1 arsenical pump-driving ATPase [Clostridium tetani]RXI71872.1 arsenical pump-driving ATPase [Clostridium tetani]